MKLTRLVACVGEMIKSHRILAGETGRDLLEDLDIDGRIILEGMLKKLGRGVCGLGSSATGYEPVDTLLSR
jgi:hypothetical protein